VRQLRTLAFAVTALLCCSWWGAAVVALPAAGPVVVSLGDSVPAGTACGCVPFPDLYARLLSARGQSINLAQPGATSSDVLSELGTPATGAALRSASVVLLMIGANDMAAVFATHGGPAAYARAAAQVHTDVLATLHRIRQAGGASVTVVVLGYWNVVEDGDVARADYDDAGTAEAAQITDQTNDALRQAAAGLARYVPTAAVFKGPTGRGDPTGLLAADGDHPNARGHAAIAAALYAAAPHPPAPHPPA
jgi:acyl-CoA thioesterase-1